MIAGFRKCSLLAVAAVLLADCGRSTLLPDQGKGSVASQANGGDLQEQPWPVFGRDPQCTRRSPADTSGNTGKLLWRLALGTPRPTSFVPQLSSPVISKDGTIYVYSAHRTLYAVTPPTRGVEAVLKWSFTAPARELPPGADEETFGLTAALSPAVGPDGTVYVSTSDALYALSAPTGELKWSYRDPDVFLKGEFYFDSLGSPTVGADGTVYSAGRKLLALDPQGDGTSGVLKWSREPGGGRDPLAIAHDGTIIQGSGDIEAIRPPVGGTKGTLAWSFPEDHQGSSPAIAADGTVYVAGYDKVVKAVSPPSTGRTGAVKWRYQTNSLYHTAPAIGADGTVYVAADVYGLFALNPNPATHDGELKWRYYHHDNKFPSEYPAVGADGTIYCAGSGNLHAISPPTSGTEGVLKWVLPLEGTRVSAPSIGADGTVYVTNDDALYAVQ